MLLVSERWHETGPRALSDDFGAARGWHVVRNATERTSCDRRTRTGECDAESYCCSSQGWRYLRRLRREGVRRRQGEARRKGFGDVPHRRLRRFDWSRELAASHALAAQRLRDLGAVVRARRDA